MPVLIALLCCLIATAFAGPLVLNPEQPVLDSGGEPGVAEFQVDLSPEDRSGLTGSGAIAVTATPNPSTEIVGEATVFIAYNGPMTTPATVRFRKAPWVPNPANEFSKDYLESCTVWTAPDSVIGARSATAWAVSRGSYYATVKSYMERHRDLSFWIGLYLDAGGVYLEGLVRYQVPEEVFVEWAPFVVDPGTLAEGHKLGYRPQDLKAAAASSISNPNGLYTINAFGWGSAADILALEAEYSEHVRPVNDNFGFSVRNRVPVAYFLEQLSGLPPEMNSGERDYTIAGLYHREQAVARINSIGLSAAAVMAAFETDYRLTSYQPLPPHAAEAMARTHTDPAWRQNMPLALVAMNREPLAEGTFSEADIIGTLAKTHRLVVAQANNAADFLAAARAARARHGPFDIVVFVGHGNGLSASCLGIEDREAFMELGGMLTPGATVMLASCSGAEYYPHSLANRLESGGSRDAHVAAAMQSAMPAARVVAATDLINKAMVTFDPNATVPEKRYRICFAGSAVWGDIPGCTARGTPRDWLRREFGPAEDWAALDDADCDGDGQPNWLEYHAGTNPRSPSDFFRISELLIAGARPAIRWTGTCRNEHAASFKVFKATNLASGDWQEVSSETAPAVFGGNYWTDPATTGIRSFYRVGVPTVEN